MLSPLVAKDEREKNDVATTFKQLRGFQQYNHRDKANTEMTFRCTSFYKLFALDAKLFKVSCSFCTAASSSSTALEQIRCTRLCRSSRHFCRRGTTGQSQHYSSMCLKRSIQHTSNMSTRAAKPSVNSRVYGCFWSGFQQRKASKLSNKLLSLITDEVLFYTKLSKN